MTLPILTHRLRIRLLQRSDLEAIHDLFSSQEAMKFIGPRRTMSRSETQTWLEEHLSRDSGSIHRMAVALKETDTLIGMCGFQRMEEHWDFGTYFRREYWGQGFASEACKAVLEATPEDVEREGFKVFIANGNTRSIQLMERLGFFKSAPASEGQEQGHYYERRGPETA